MGNEIYKKLNKDAEFADWEVVEKDDFAPVSGKYSPTYEPQVRNKTENNKAKNNKAAEDKKKTDKTFSDWTILLDYKSDPNIVLPKGNKSEVVYYRKKEQIFTDEKGEDMKVITDFAFMDKMKLDLPKTFFNNTHYVEDRKKKLFAITEARLKVFKKHFHDTYDGKNDGEVDVKQREADRECLEFLEAVSSYAQNNVTAVHMITKRKEIENRRAFAEKSVEKYNKQIEDLREELNKAIGDDEEAVARRKDIQYKIDSLQEIADDYQKQIDDKTESNSVIAQYKDEAQMSTIIKKYLDKCDTLSKEQRTFLAPFRKYFKKEFAYGKGPEDNSEVKDFTGYRVIHSRIKRESLNKDKNLLTEDDYENAVENIPMRDCKDEPLFTHAPSVFDVAQGRLGNCYLMAGITAMVNDDPGIIRDMMYDDGQGNAIVRLYYYDPTTKKSKPVYYKVKKQVPDTDEYTFSRGPLWVKILEYVFAAYKTDFHGRNNITNIAPGLTIKPNVLDMRIEESGMVTEAFATFTGKKVSFYINNKDGKNQRQFSKYYVRGNASYKNYYGDKIVSESFKHSVSGTKYFQGKYSSYALDIFKRIDKRVGKGVKHKKTIVAATARGVETIQNKYFVEDKKEDTSSLNSAIEMQDASGVLSRHSYTVVGTHEDKKTGNKFIIMKNPWGLYNNNYFTDTNGTVYSHYTETEETSGICVLELNQFMNRVLDFAVL